MTMFGRFFGGKNSRDISADAESFEDRSARFQRDKVFIDVHSKEYLKAIMDEARAMFFTMKKLADNYPPESLETLLLNKGQEKYLMFVQLLNSDSLKYDDVVKGALELASDMSKIMRWFLYLDKKVIIPVTPGKREDLKQQRSRRGSSAQMA